MKVTEVQKTEQGVLYRLEQPQIFRSDCISFDDSEVNHTNASDVLESCKETSYNHLLQIKSGNYDLYYPAGANGLPVYDLPILSYATGKTSEAMMKLYGNDTMLYHIHPEAPHHQCDYDSWHPDHKI